MVYWLHCCGFVVRQNIMAVECVAEGATEREEEREREREREISV
jgi:hypothetical protein